MRKINTLQKVNVVSIQLVKEKSVVYGSKQITSARDAALIAEEFLAGADREDKAAILANSNAIILIHNHPSGDPTPSREDLKITKRLVEAGNILGIEVINHVVIGDNGHYVSLKERGDI